MLNMPSVAGDVNGQPVDDPTHDRSPWFKFYVDDWTAGTVGLSDEEAGFYIRLLSLMWSQRGGLPVDPDAIAKLMGRDCRPVRRLVRALTEKGKLKEARGKLINGRMYKTIVEHQKQAQNASKPRNGDARSGKNPEEIPEKSPKNLPKKPRQPEQNQGLSLSLPEPDPEPEKKTEPSKDGSGARKRAEPKRKSLDTRLPDDWVLPDEWRDWALINYAPDREVVHAEAERFRDYWHAAAGSKGRKRDWAATWRNWCRNANGAPATMRRRPVGAPERNEVVPAWVQERNRKMAAMRRVANGEV